MSGINDNKHHFHAHGVHPSGKDKAEGKPEHDAPSEALAQATPRFEGKTPEAIFAALQQQSSGALNNVTVGRLQSLFSGDFHKKATLALDIAANELGLDPNNANHAMLLSDIDVGAL